MNIFNLQLGKKVQLFTYHTVGQFHFSFFLNCTFKSGLGHALGPSRTGKTYSYCLMSRPGTDQKTLCEHSSASQNLEFVVDYYCPVYMFILVTIMNLGIDERIDRFSSRKIQRNAC